MKKSLKALAVYLATGALITAGAFAAYAEQTGEGEWRTEGSDYWYALSADGSEYASNGWYNIQDTDGVIYSYYFDADGWLQVSTEVEGYTVDSQGRYTVDGAAQTYDAASVSYTAAGTLSVSDASEETEAVEETAEAEVTTADLLAGSETSETASKSIGIASGGAYSAEDDPANAASTIDFTRSSISGSTATNSWSGFRITLPGTPTAGEDDNTDWYYEEEDVGMIVSSYYPLSKFDASSLDEFIDAFTSSKRGFAPAIKNGTVTNSGTTSLGGIQFTKLTRMDPTPLSESYKDYCYMRMVNGLVHVLIFDYYGDGESWSSVLNNISSV